MLSSQGVRHTKGRHLRTPAKQAQGNRNDASGEAAARVTFQNCCGQGGQRGPPGKHDAPYQNFGGQKLFSGTPGTCKFSGSQHVPLLDQKLDAGRSHLLQPGSSSRGGQVLRDALSQGLPRGGEKGHTAKLAHEPRGCIDRAFRSRRGAVCAPPIQQRLCPSSIDVPATLSNEELQRIHDELWRKQQT